MQASPFLAASTLALALSAGAAAAPAQAAQAELYIDVATHAMPGMPGMGAMGRLAGAMGGQHASYGMTRHPGMPGRYMDVALHNRAAPGQPATQAIPKGLRLGKSIELLPRERSQDQADGTVDGSGALGLADGSSYRVRYFWGCGEQARGRQPVEYSMTVRNGKPVQGGRAMAPRRVPAQGPDIGPQHVLWPNPGARRGVSDKASLVGSHQLDGEGLPDAMQFALGQADDFLPNLELASSGSPGDGMTLEWTPVDGARGYFIHAMASQGDTIVMWSSSEDGYAGPELMDYLPEPLLAQWAGKRTVLGADARSCRIPTEVFAGVDAAPVVQMIAYGSQRSIAQPRPADAARDWTPAWNVRVRSKSTAMLMPGMAGTTPRDAARPAAKEAARGLLRGLLGN
ncbi:hypothetical protein Psesu_0416 [Pseudoxanthomonas suwonensis 11-1]|uniref:Uncharacterized protein n=1 Tax=Pseudoxanthomonas suwonensis (strain 11-1) TaxID=743721 RepID=E6WQ26_PSEUU|nr:hypothetical protein [Pseudoxanthomonas suwonensis]ADV26275.1 hypothetical protein Psesu_0416 [Pseudoxanthomonas suwonensis 11-1]